MLTSCKLSSQSEIQISFPIIKKKGNFEIHVLRYGNKGDFGVYGDRELEKPVYFLKIIENNIAIDSIEINKSIIGESTYLKKYSNESIKKLRMQFKITQIKQNIL